MKNFLLLLITQLLFVVIAMAQPAYDSCQGALDLGTVPTSGTEITGTINTAGATASTAYFTGSCGIPVGDADDEVWFKFTIPAGSPMAIKINFVHIGGATDIFMQQMSGCGDTMNIGACSDNDAVVNLATMTPGDHYIRMWTKGTGVSTIKEIKVKKMDASEDECSTAPMWTTIDRQNSADVSIAAPTLSTVGMTASGTSVSGYCSSTTGVADDDIWSWFYISDSLDDVWIRFFHNSGATDIAWQLLYTSCGASMTTLYCSDSDYGQWFADMPSGYYMFRMWTEAAGVSTTQQVSIIGSPIESKPCGAITIADGAADTTYRRFYAASPSGVTVPSCDGYTMNNGFDMWYKIVMDADGVANEPLTLTAYPATDMDIAMYVYKGDCDALNLIACSDTGFTGTAERLILTGVDTLPGGAEDPNAEVYVRVMNWGFNEGPFIITANGVALPLELISFDAVKENNQAKLFWKMVAKEDDNTMIDVEKSNDGKTWNTIAKDINPISKDEFYKYEYYDVLPEIGKNFYRLKMTNFNGTINYSAIKLLHFGKDAHNDFTIFPNPANTKLAINSNEKLQNATLNLYNVLGEKVYSIQTNNTSEWQINTSELPNGFYMLQINYDNLLFSEKIQIIH